MFIDAPFYNDPIETLAFNGYAMHTSHLDNIVNDIVNNYYLTGETNFTVSTDLSTQDIDYITTQVGRLIR